MPATTARKKARKNVGRKKKIASRKATVEAGPMVLPEHPCIKEIGKLKKALIATRTAGGSPIRIDASQVEAIDTAALQLLVAFSNSVRKLALTIEWIAPSAAFLGMADLSDLSRHLGIASGTSDSATAASEDDLCPVF